MWQSHAARSLVKCNSILYSVYSFTGIIKSALEAASGIRAAGIMAPRHFAFSVTMVETGGSTFFLLFPTQRNAVTVQCQNSRLRQSYDKHRSIPCCLRAPSSPFALFHPSSLFRCTHEFFVTLSDKEANMFFSRSELGRDKHERDKFYLGNKCCCLILALSKENAIYLSSQWFIREKFITMLNIIFL